MRGNAALVLSFVCLVLPGPSKLTAQPAQPVFIFNGQQAIQLVDQTTVTLPNPVAFVPPTGDLLEFVDGSLMHGELKGMDTASGLSWENPAAKNPINLQPGHIDSIHFAHAASVTLAPTSHLRLANGDDLFGSVTSLDDDHLGFSTWFGGALAISRASVQSITFLPTNYTILYEGPSDANDWIIGSPDSGSWIFRDGTFSSETPGTLGRDFKLSGSSTVEFDLAWKDTFVLRVSIYADAVDHLDFGNSYVFDFTPTQVRLHHLQTVETAPLLIPAGKNKVRITLQSNKEEGTLAVLVDNVLAKRWKDQNGFSATGGGLLFQQPGMAGAGIKLSNFKISQWQGRYEPETSVVATNVDALRFINHDQASGKIAGINDGKVTLSMDGTPLQIPIQRVTQINFAATAPVAPAAGGPWAVRAHFQCGGSLSFQLEKWNEKEISGRSDIFGSVTFQPGQIQQLEFNLDRAKADISIASDREFEDLHE